MKEKIGNFKNTIINPQYINMIRQILTVVIFICGYYTSMAQQVTEMKFDQLQPLLQQEDDTVYIINFWATWCVPCVKELPDFEKIYELYKDKNFKMILVSLDYTAGTEKRVEEFVRSRKISPEVILLKETNSNDWIDKVSNDWSGAIPGTLIYGKHYREFFEKGLNFDELNDILKPLLP